VSTISKRLRLVGRGGGPETNGGAVASSGRVRLGKKTKDLVKTLGPGDVAVIAHRNIDRIAAEDLAASGVGVVLNNQPSSDDRYPNQGPLILIRAGVRLIDFEGIDLFDALHEGDEVTLEGGKLIRDGVIVATGEDQLLPDLERRLAAQQEQIHVALAAFAENTVSRLEEEGEMLSGAIELPETRTDFRGKHVLIVVRGPTYKSDLKALRSYIRDVKPILIGVDGGADAIREAGFKPSMIVGDMDSASEETLQCGAELVVHAYTDGRAPGRELLEELGVPYKVVAAPGTSQDIAMIIAAEKGAELIVSVGSQFNLVEFLDKNRRGMSSTFLTRLRLGEILVDAKGVSRMYRPRPGFAPVLLVAIVGLIALAGIILVTPGLKEVADLLWLKLQLLIGLDP